MIKKKQEKKNNPNLVNKKKIKKIPEGRGIINCYFSFNNTIINLSKENGEVLKQVSAGSSGYRGTKKATSYAAQKTADKIIEAATDYGINVVKLKLRGIGSGRDAVIKKICESESLITEALIDITPIPFNGTRSRKQPRK